MLLLPTYLIASILSLMRVEQVETILWIGSVAAMLPDNIHIRCLNGTEYLINEVRNMGTLLLQVIKTILDILLITISLQPTELVLITAALEPHLKGFLLHQRHNINRTADCLRTGTLLNHVDISLG